MPDPAASNAIPATSGTAASPARSPAERSNLECRLRVASADIIKAVAGPGQPNYAPLPPPEYFGANATHGDQGLQQKQTAPCLLCLPPNSVKYDTHYLACPQHSTKASLEKRTDPDLHMKGAELRGATS